MNYLIIPTSADPFYNELVNLEGTDYKFTFNYNQRESCYYLSISTPDGTDLVNGVKLVGNWPLLHKYAYDGLPPGELFCFSNTGTPDPPPGLAQIGAGLPFTLMYIPSILLP